MPDALSSLQHQTVKRCPACGRVNAASNRCLHCLRDIAAVAPLAPEEVAAALNEAPILRGDAGRRWFTVRRTLLGTLGVVVLVVGWWLYAAFIAKPTPPEAPSSTARSMAAGAWPTQDGDSRGTRSTATSARVGGVEAWRVSLGSPATALVTDGRLLVAPLQDGRLVAFEASSGKGLWSTTLSLSNPPLAAPVIAGDRVYVQQREGLLVAISATDGKEIWNWRNDDGSFDSSPLVVEGVLYSYSTDGLFAFDAEDGRMLWKHLFATGWANVAPIVEGHRLLIAADDQAVVYDRTTGERTYSLMFSRARPASITIREGAALAVNGRVATAFDASSRNSRWGRLLGVSIRGGETLRSFWFRMYLYGMAPAPPIERTLWDVTLTYRKTMAAAVGQDLIMIASPDGGVTALARADGKPAWTAKTSPLRAAPIITSDGVLLVEEGRLLLLDLATGQQRGERSIGGLRGATPSEAATFITTDAGDLIALR